jgi:cystathionine beta-lyase
MRYNFDKIIDRKNTNSVKWDENSKVFGTEDVLPMWVADMDFECAKPIVDAVVKRVQHPVYGYGFAPESAYAAVISKVKRAYG